MSLQRRRLPKGGLTAGQKSAEGIVGHAVGKASEALQCRKTKTTDVRSERAGQRVMESITRFIANKLKLKVNETKSR